MLNININGQHFCQNSLPTVKIQDYIVCSSWQNISLSKWWSRSLKDLLKFYIHYIQHSTFITFYTHYMKTSVVDVCQKTERLVSTVMSLEKFKTPKFKTFDNNDVEQSWNFNFNAGLIMSTYRIWHFYIRSLSCRHTKYGTSTFSCYHVDMPNIALLHSAVLML